MKEEILLVKIHNSLAEGKSDYEATRGNWRMSKHRFPYIQYVAGVHHGKVVCVFQPEEWEIIEEGPDKGRKRFTGTKASSEVLKKLQMVEDKVMRKFGSGNAIAYLSLDELDQLVSNYQTIKYAKHHTAKSNDVGENVLDRIKGGLFGLAIGDALGATTEFMSAGEIRGTHGKVTDIIGGGWLDLPPGEVTDDTAMTIAVAKGIIRNKENPIAEIGEEFLKWYKTNPPDVGNIIRTVFSLYAGDWFDAAYRACRKLGGKCAGNGSLMRCLPIALAYADQEKMEEVTVLHSNMTHHDSQAAEACLIYNRIASRLLHGEKLSAAIRQEVVHTRYEPLLTVEPACSPDGYVVHTMSWVLHWLLRCESFEDVVISAVNMGGDSDTIAAIAGGLKGLEVGYHQLPSRFTEKIVCADELEELAVQLVNIRG